MTYPVEKNIFGVIQSDLSRFTKDERKKIMIREFIYLKGQSQYWLLSKGKQYFISDKLLVYRLSQ
jgi:hypothetical protein